MKSSCFPIRHAGVLLALLSSPLAHPAFAETLADPHLTHAHPTDGRHVRHSFGHDADASPISVMGDHLHPAGEWMVSARYMFMDMDGMRNGTSPVSPGEVFGAGFTVTPTRMTMEMAMFGLMYAPTDSITLMAMLPYTELEMDHRIFPGAAPLIALNGGRDTFTTRSSGIGDLRLSSLFGLFARGHHHLHGGLGVSLPTASIAGRDLAPGPGGLIPRQLPAAMQTGSGSIDILSSLTYGYHSGPWTVGAQARGTFRTETNHHDYRLGNRFELDAWFSHRPISWFAFNGGLSYRWEGELSGLQSGIALRPPFAPSRLTVPTAFGSNYGGQRIEAILGANFRIPEGPLYGHSLAADLRLPLWRDRNGYGLETDFTATLGWQFVF